MSGYRYHSLTLPEDIRESSAEHPIPLERLGIINATASAPVKRRRSIPSTIRATTFPKTSISDATQDQSNTMDPPQAQTPVDLESFLSEELRQFIAQMDTANPFVLQIMETLNEILATIIRTKFLEGAGTAKISNIHRFYVKEASHAILSIYSAWSKYPQAGGTLEGAKISSIDYRYTVMDTVEGPHESLPSKIAIFIANKIDPRDIDFQTVAHEQKRINDCNSAMKQTYKIWQTQLDPPRFLSDDALQDELTSESASPITYTTQHALGDAPNLTQPSTPANLMSAAAMTEQAEYEMHDNVHVFVGNGKVLKNQAEKRSDLAQQLDITRKADAKEARESKKAQKAQKAADALAAREAKGRNKKKAVVVSSSDYEDVDEQPEPKPSRKSIKINVRKRPSAEMEADSSNVDGNDVDDNDAEIPKKTPAPRKRAKKAASKDASNDGSSEKAPRESNHGKSDYPEGTVAPDNAKRGGAAPKWLRDEDNLGKQLIMVHPAWPMPRVYKEFNRQLANTAYQTDKMETHKYRADWIEFPRTDAAGKTMNDKAARKFDICWRTYESVRQHLEKHKAKANNDNVLKPFPWTQITENPVAHLPKRDPPPRPDFFKDGYTPVPQLDSESTVAEESSAEEASVDVTPEPQGKEHNNFSGWTPINKTSGISSTLPSVDSSPAPPAKKRRQPKKKAPKDMPQIATSEFANPVVSMQSEIPADRGQIGSAPGDENVDDPEDTIEDPSDGDDGDLERFIRNQSDGKDDDIEPTNDQFDGPADGGQPARTQQGALGGYTMNPSRPASSRLPPLALSQSQGLPSGWTQSTDPHPGPDRGRIYYLDHRHQRTTWLDPTTPGFDERRAFGGPNATAPRYPRDHVWVNDQHVHMATAGLATSGPSASYSDLGIANLPSPGQGSIRRPMAAGSRRPAAISGSRVTASTSSATVASAGRPSLIVKLPVKRRFSAEKNSRKDDKPEA
ncbi:hypothetical protein Q7P35_006646 [Cladosporium inversicolor]